MNNVIHAGSMVALSETIVMMSCLVDSEMSLTSTAKSSMETALDAKKEMEEL